MKRPWYALASFILIAAGMLLLLWRWHLRHVSSVDIGIGLFVLGGIPAILWLMPRVPPRSAPQKLPASFWLGLAMVMAGVLSISVLAIPVKVSIGRTRAIGYSVSAGTGPTITVASRPPAAAVEALSAILPGARIADSFSAITPSPSWEFLIARGNRLIAEATWDGHALTFVNLGWNFYLNRQPAPKNTYPWNQLRQVVDLPPNTKVLGPYRLPGYDVMVVPDMGQIWDLNTATGQPQGGGL